MSNFEKSGGGRKVRCRTCGEIFQFGGASNLAGLRWQSFAYETWLGKHGPTVCQPCDRADTRAQQNKMPVGAKKI